jgi:hypothetical protein
MILPLYFVHIVSCIPTDPGRLMEHHISPTCFKIRIQLALRRSKWMIVTSLAQREHSSTYSYTTPKLYVPRYHF